MIVRRFKWLTKGIVVPVDFISEDFAEGASGLIDSELPPNVVDPQSLL
jgi:hypothetical protein